MDIRSVIAKGNKFVIGMVHCLALPGTAEFGGDVKKIMDQAVADALTLEKAGVDAVIVENMNDNPFGATLDTPQVAALSAATARVRDAVSIPVGVDAAFNDCVASLSIAKANGCQFVRIPVLVDTVLFTNGLITPCSKLCMETRRNLEAADVMVLADVQVKHAHMVLPDMPVETSAKEAASCGADAIIVTGSAIGVETPIDMIRRVKSVVDVPVIAGSGVKAENIDEQLNIADGAIIGSSLKKGGDVHNPIDYDLVREVLDALHK
ncbi:MAG TPA: BtpA/SgcQ family protein [Candidatus Olsenella pullistercoris]|uniref:BtpA/SgcQ family protein n=1 Tax=Candidatus Olsenella pullistercoris TaxID=2838712 RepID=A0A9D2JEL7_9ACTN|nr:BtpA/SgcQ family protein [Candidatus Olsenella pullistercoris]